MVSFKACFDYRKLCNIIDLSNKISLVENARNVSTKSIYENIRHNVTFKKIFMFLKISIQIYSFVRCI